jgi:hypothetical protein
MKKKIFQKLNEIVEGVLLKLNLKSKCEILESPMYSGICVWICHSDFLNSIESEILKELENFEMPVRIRSQKISYPEAQILLIPIF